MDAVMVSVSDNEFVKGLVLVLFWWVWNTRGPDRQRRREILLATLPSPFLAFFTGRLLAHLLPYRTRPIADAAFHWHVAYGLNVSTVFRTWSSMPSDHAACFAAIAFSLFLASRRIGLLAFAYTAIVIDLPRVYLGLHYPSDILAGSLVGVACTAICVSMPMRNRLVSPMLKLQELQPSAFYAAVFLCLYTVGCINSVHGLFTVGSEFLKAWSHHPQVQALSPPFAVRQHGTVQRLENTAVARRDQHVRQAGVTYPSQPPSLGQ